MQLPKYLPFADGKWQLNMGVKPLDLATLIEIDDKFEYELLLKEKLLADRYPDVFAALPGSEPSQQEVLEVIIAHLQQYFPQYYQWSEEAIACPRTGQVWKFADFAHAPLDLAGRILQEDIVIMESSPDGYILTAASECFRLRWNLQEKMGQPLAKIHSPVPGYDKKLQHPMDNLFAKIQVQHPIWRMNWSIVDDPVMLLEPSNSTLELDPRITTDNAGETLWLRMERQCLRRLPQTGAIIFFTHTYVDPLSILRQIPGAATALISTIELMPKEMQNYKNLLPIRQALLSYLEKIAEGEKNKVTSASL